jgi:hypothetical protein
MNIFKDFLYLYKKAQRNLFKILSYKKIKDFIVISLI